MQLAFAPELKAFRQESADWLNQQLDGPFKAVRGQTNHNDNVEERRAWEQALEEARWSVVGWPEQWGGRNASIAEQCPTSAWERSARPSSCCGQAKRGCERDHRLGAPEHGELQGAAHRGDRESSAAKRRGQDIAEGFARGEHGRRVMNLSGGGPGSIGVQSLAAVVTSYPDGHDHVAND